jgi:hypothetical protein
MEVKGDLWVRRTGIFDRRADQGLHAEALSGNRTVVRHDYHWLALNGGAAGRDVTLPDATTLPLGWRIVIQNTGTTDVLSLKDNGGGALSQVGFVGQTATPVCVEAVLYGNASAPGQWFLIDMSDFDVETVVAGKFVANFVVADWPVAVSGYQSITPVEVAGLGVATHTRGAHPVYIVQEKIGSDFDRTICDRERMGATGDLALRIVDGIAFDGRVIFV